MKTVVITKLIDPQHIECRDYNLFKEPLKLIHCTVKDYKLCLHEDCEYMILSLAMQKKGRVINTQQSKFPPYSYYKIYKFLWKPTKPEKDLDALPASMSEMLSNLKPEQLEKLRHKLGLDKHRKRV